MITIFELKHHKCCRLFIRTPFYIKNLLLMILLSILLLVVYFVYFRKDCMTITNIPKVLKGLNSNTFNYLEMKSDQLRIGKLLNNYPPTMPTNIFMADCLRINKPCKFEGLASQWPAFEKWRIEGYLLDKLSQKEAGEYQ